MAIKEFFLGKKDSKSAGKRNVDNVVNEAMTGKKAAPKSPPPKKKK